MKMGHNTSQIFSKSAFFTGDNWTENTKITKTVNQLFISQCVDVTGVVCNFFPPEIWQSPLFGFFTMLIVKIFLIA